MPEVVDDVERLTGLYGPDPMVVGVADGTEDDYGDMLHELSLIADIDVEDDDARTSLDATIEKARPATWAAAIELATKLRDEVLARNA